MCPYENLIIYLIRRNNTGAIGINKTQTGGYSRRVLNIETH